MKKLLLTALLAAIAASAQAGVTVDVGPHTPDVPGSGKRTPYVAQLGVNVFEETFDQVGGSCGLTTDALVTGGPFAYAQGTTPNFHAAPYQDTTCYAYGPINGLASTPIDPQPPGAHTGTLSSVLIDYLPLLTTLRAAPGNAGLFLDYFGLYYGSIDEYNMLQFYADADGNSATTNDLTLVATVTGAQILAACNPACTPGDQNADATNVFVNLNFTSDVGFSAVRFSTWGVAVEVDNVTVGFDVQRVPEPASLALTGLALSGLGFASRRRRANKVA